MADSQALASALDSWRTYLSDTILQRESIAAQAAAAHEVLTQLNLSLDSTDNDASTHLRSLARAVDDAETRKRSALETEAVSAEDAIVALEAKGADVAVVLSRDELMPRHPVEPLVLYIAVPVAVGGVAPREQCLAARLVCPPALRSSDVLVHVLSPSVRLGRATALLSLSVAQHACSGRVAEDFDAWRTALLRHSRANATLRGIDGSEGSEGVPLSASFAVGHAHSAISTADAPIATASVTYVVSVPEGTVGGTEVVVSDLSFGGAPLALRPQDSGSSSAVGESCSVLRFPVRVGGLQPPLELRGADGCPLVSVGNWHSPGVSSDGVLYVPQTLKDTLFAFSASGEPLAGIELRPLGVANSTRAVAHDDGSGLLVLGADRQDGDVIAIDAEPPHAIRWRVTPGTVRQCFGLSILPLQGIVVCVSYRDNRVRVLSLSDGSECGGADLSLQQPTYITADPATGVVFVSAHAGDGEGYAVSILEWQHGELGAALKLRGTLEAAGAGPRQRPLAYVPASPVCPAAHLVVATCNTPNVAVFELPGLRLVCDTAQPVGPSARIYGLAGDPCGGALVVNDAESGAVRAVAWPLAEMAALK